jgi:hypothetical protein
MIREPDIVGYIDYMGRLSCTACIDGGRFTLVDEPGIRPIPVYRGSEPHGCESCDNCGEKLAAQEEDTMTQYYAQYIRDHDTGPGVMSDIIVAASLDDLREVTRGKRPLGDPWTIFAASLQAAIAMAERDGAESSCSHASVEASEANAASALRDRSGAKHRAIQAAKSAKNAATSADRAMSAAAQADNQASLAAARDAKKAAKLAKEYAAEARNAASVA